ncbi:PASTA domain-containing protein [Paenibacillus cremeus]|uniref:PASTA domain-containing protein n=1 Tax=Paenibacillus cremeus TaxID=2163881 RepID=A0A559JVQ0_9BACL|nr:PASTA domain-containing protein [Paenibacillus cremeus]TVY03974.1 PASTA domain-containing protein [Paenibacillus cremeus]
MNHIAKRYILEQPLTEITNGLLVRGMDLTFQRSVLLYTFQESDELALQEALRRMKKAFQVSGEHFMHVLDAGSENETLFAVLQAYSGSPLFDRLIDLEITGHKALMYVLELAKGIRETRRNRLPECAVDAKNLWLDDNGRLRIINFWAEGKYGRRGVEGLALLLYQLGAKTDIPTSSISAYSFEMNRLFADLSEPARARAVALASKAYEGLCSLGDFQQELEALLDFGHEGKELPLLKPREPRSQPRITTATDRKNSEQPALFREWIQRLRWPLFAAAGSGVLVLLLWLTLRPLPYHSNGSKPQTTPTTVPTAIATNRTETPKPPPPATSSQARTDVPLNKASEVEAQPENDSTIQAKMGIVPNLVAHTREDAEKLAIASGLRYQFYLEANDADKGIVFKQDLTPGTAVNNGDRISFWVSKGKSNGE